MVVGLTTRLLPVPTDVPPHDPLYQAIIAPVPIVPPLSVRVTLEPVQIVVELVIVVGFVDF